MARPTFTAYDSGLEARANRVIAQGALTNSKRPASFVKGVYPTHFRRGSGPYVWDMNGNRYTDFICGLGSCLFGHSIDPIKETIRGEIENGITLSLGTPLEIELAEKLLELLPHFGKVRFFKNGGDACSAAIRIARAATGRDLILSEGYHGADSEFISMTPPAYGIPENKNIKPLTQYNSSEPVAGVIIEPVMTDFSDDRVKWLSELRQNTKDHGIPLIFDEIITGFRFERMFVSNRIGIWPDILCIGKAMAGGMPLSAVLMTDEIYEKSNDWFYSQTFAGERLSLACGIRTLELLGSKFDLSYLWESGASFQTRFNEISSALQIKGYPTRGVFEAKDDLTKALFFQEALKSGLLFGPSFFFGFQHIPLMDETLSACRDVMTKIKSGVVKLEGELPKKPFAEKMREKAK